MVAMWTILTAPVLELIYPANGQPLGQLHAATPAIVEEALASAIQAQKAWAATSDAQRGRILRRAADMIRAQNHALSVLETYDTGKPLSETLCADATSGADALEYFGGLAGSLTGEHIQLGEDWVYTIREALGGLCRNWSMELSHSNRLLESSPCAGMRQYNGVQTIRNNTGMCFENR